MNKLDKSYEDYQILQVTNIELIKNFLNTFIPIWEEDILKFENFKHLLTPENIKVIDFYSYISIEEDLNYTFIFNDDSRRNFSLDIDVLIKWLTKNNLIK